MRQLEYFEPTDVATVLALLAEDKRRTVIAGGTDLIPQMKRGQATPPALVSLAHVPALRRIDDGPDGLTIGATVSLAALERDPALRARHPALHAAITHVAAGSIRSAATLGGNVCLDTKCIYRDQVQTWNRALPPCFKSGGDRCYVVPAGKTCHASLAGDTVPALIAADAEATVVSPSGQRRVAIEALHAGDSLHPLALAADELLTEIRLPPPDGARRSVYLRFSHRKALDFAVASVAISVARANGTGARARVVLGAVAPRPVRLAGIEARLQSETATEALVRDCARQAPEEALRASRSGRIDEFVRHLISRLVEQGLRRVLLGAEG